MFSVRLIDNIIKDLVVINHDFMKIVNKISQKEKILALYSSLQEAHTLFFVTSTKLNAWEVKNDRKTFKNNSVFLYKSNTYRSVKIINDTPVINRLSGGLRGPFFFAYTVEENSYKQIREIFNIKVEHMKVLCAIQNNIFFSKNRILLAEKLPEKKTISCFLNIPVFYFLIQNLYFFLIKMIRYPKLLLI